MKKNFIISSIVILSIFYAGCEKDKNVEEIKEGNEIPIANFDASPRKGPAPLTVKFTDRSINIPTSWLWTLGDNSTSTVKNPIRTYTKEGVYSVTLTVTNKIGTDTKMDTSFIEVTASNTKPTAYFNILPNVGTINTIYLFDASGSTDDYDNINDLLVRWDFDGDGSWDTDWESDKNRNHRYSDTGNYSAKLEVKDSDGLIGEYEKSVQVKDNAPPNAIFTINPPEGFINSIFLFDATNSTDDGLQNTLEVRWDFNGDGSWDTDWKTDRNHHHQYSTEGVYNAKLEVKDAEGLTDQYSNSITVHCGCDGETTLTYGGQSYEIVEIGYDCWMAENLNYETPNSWWYENNSANGSIYGRLYTMEAALEACPTGWHLPSDEEWIELEVELGMSLTEIYSDNWRGIDVGKKMKSINGWSYGGNGTNSVNFSALPGGYVDNNETFLHIKDKGFWWSSSEKSETKAWYRHLHYNKNTVYRNNFTKEYGLSVRCIKD